MKLTYEQLCAVCLGAVRSKKTEQGVQFYRFTVEQEEFYRQVKEDSYDKTFAAAGIKLCFETDSESLFLKVNVTAKSVRTYFSVDIKVNDTYFGEISNFADVDLPQDYTRVPFPLGVFSKGFVLGKGKKKVTIYLPGIKVVEIRELSLDDDCYIKPVKPSKKLLAFGDSITQGFDALHASATYTAKLAEALDAEEYNKGIGGQIFLPALARLRDDLEPDYITVAYGTNDWSTTKKDDFRIRCYEFFDALCKNYPNAKIFAITPLWRKDRTLIKSFGVFESVTEEIEAIVKNFPDIICVKGDALIPHEENYFADLRLHPNDLGFEYYYRGLYEEIRKVI